MSISAEAESLMIERFGHDGILSLATSAKDIPSVRYVNAFYDDGAFYVLTYALSGKIRQIGENPNVALAGDWFTARGEGVNLGFFGREENQEIAEKMKRVFAEWIGNGHSDLSDENTVILKIRLTTGVLMSHGTRYDLVF